MHFIGQAFRAEKARERGHEDQEREQRRQDRQGDVARNGPTVILRKARDAVVENPKDKAHRSAASCRPGLNETPGQDSPLHSCAWSLPTGALSWQFKACRAKPRSAR